MTKKCTKCGYIKADDEFYKNKYTKSGLQSYCKQCDKEQRNENRFKIIKAKQDNELLKRGVTRADPYGSRRNPELKNRLELRCSHCKRWMGLEWFKPHTPKPQITKVLHEGKYHEISEEVFQTRRRYSYICYPCSSEILNAIGENKHE